MKKKCPVCGYKFDNPQSCMIGNGKFRICFKCIKKITTDEKEQQLLFLMLHKANQIHKSVKT